MFPLPLFMQKYLFVKENKTELGTKENLDTYLLGSYFKKFND